MHDQAENRLSKEMNQQRANTLLEQQEKHAQFERQMKETMDRHNQEVAKLTECIDQLKLKEDQNKEDRNNLLN